MRAYERYQRMPENGPSRPQSSSDMRGNTAMSRRRANRFFAMESLVDRHAGEETAEESDAAERREPPAGNKARQRDSRFSKRNGCYAVKWQAVKVQVLKGRGRPQRAPPCRDTQAQQSCGRPGRRAVFSQRMPTSRCSNAYAERRRSGTAAGSHLRLFLRRFRAQRRRFRPAAQYAATKRAVPNATSPARYSTMSRDAAAARRKRKGIPSQVQVSPPGAPQACRFAARYARRQQ